MKRAAWGILPLALAAPAASALAGEGIDPVYAQSGDVAARSAVVWGRCNREKESRLAVDLGGSPAALDRTTGRMRVVGPAVSAASDYTGSVTVRILKPGRRYYYRVLCIKTGNGAESDKSPIGVFRTAHDPDQARPVKFLWAADLAGQGWGRNPGLAIRDVSGRQIKGGYLAFEVMRRLQPDFAIFQGDIIYADNPAPPRKPIPEDVGGGIWTNESGKDFVAISLAQYRQNWKYNLGDAAFRNFLLSTPVYSQWDDHEVTDNWYPGEILTGAPYGGIAADLLAARARQALYEYNAIGGEPLYRRFRHGKHLEIFLLDERSYRGANTDNSNPDGSEMLGSSQFDWLIKGLKSSSATWKVISSHDPLSIVTGGPNDRDAWAQEDPAVLGREVQLARILKVIRDDAIENVVFIASDVHFAAAISYRPARATFPDFKPFWEFVAGPLHAGAFGPGALDGSFGPELAFVRGPFSVGIGQNAPPPHLQSFGAVEVGASGTLTVRLHDVTGAVIFERIMTPN